MLIPEFTFLSVFNITSRVFLLHYQKAWNMFFGIFMMSRSFESLINNLLKALYLFVSLISDYFHKDLNSLTTKEQTTKFTSANFQKMLSPCYIILRAQRLEGKQCRSRWGGSLWAISTISTLFVNSAFFVSGTYRVNPVWSPICCVVVKTLISHSYSQLCKVKICENYIL